MENKKLIIGSTAIKYHFNDFKRIPKDIDYLVEDKNKYQKTSGIEYLENPILFKNKNEFFENGYLKPSIHYTLILSHLVGWNINWEKHMWSVQFLKGKGCILNKSLFEELYKYWETIHNKNKRSDLKMSLQDFFNNALESEFEHDFIHTLINPVPTYTKILKDGAEVETDENKFNQLSFEEKCDLTREEVYVMAWERYKEMDFRIAYSKMLKKFIVSHAPIFQALFIIENFVYLHKPNKNYYAIIETGLREIKQVTTGFTKS